jgi:hypothetical protein
LIEEQRDLSRVNSVKVSDYQDCVADYRTAGEPVSHWFFHRSLSTLVRAAADARFVLDALEEPMLNPEADTTSAWGQWRSIPPFLVARLRPALAFRSAATPREPAPCSHRCTEQTETMRTPV